MKNVILDIGYDIDSAIALLLALAIKEFKVEAICTSWDPFQQINQSRYLEEVLNHYKLDVPVFNGVHEAIVRPLYRPNQQDKNNVISTSAPSTQMQHAPFYYLERLTQGAEQVHIITTGPLSNLATAISLSPNSVETIASLTILGGGYKNVDASPYAETIFLSDPEAVQILLNSKIHPIIIPLDASQNAYLTAKEFKDVCRNSSPVCKVLKSLAKVKQNEKPDSASFSLPACLSIISLLKSSVLDGLKPIRMDLVFNGKAQGHCVIDRRENAELPNCSFAFSSDRRLFKNVFQQILSQELAI